MATKKLPSLTRVIVGASSHGMGGPKGKRLSELEIVRAFVRERAKLVGGAQPPRLRRSVPYNSCS